VGAAKELLGVVTGQTDRVFDAQQSAIYRANFKLFRGVVYSAVMEKRTCVVCAGYDGTIYWMEKVPKGEKGETFAKKPALPIHPSCRCAYVPFCKSWEELPIDDNEFSKSARKLLGGDIPKTRKWEEWFLSRTEGVQKKILGETRFNLWKARAVEIKDLSVGSKVVPLADLIEAPKVAKKLAEVKKGLIPQKAVLPEKPTMNNLGLRLNSTAGKADEVTRTQALKVLDSAASESERLMAKYPQLLKVAVKQVKVGDTMLADMRCVGLWDTKGKTMWLRRGSADKVAIERSKKLLKQKLRSSTGADTKAIYRHEFGHAVQDQLLTPEEIFIVREEFLDASESLLTAEISRYAATEPEEAFSELFSLMTGGKRIKIRSLSRTQKIIQRILL